METALVVPPIESYIKERMCQLQRGIINGKMCRSNTLDSSIWISRTTGCDVISVVTTTAPIKNGDMKDIRQHNKEMRRIRAPVARPPGKMLPGNPLEDGQVVDLDRTHAKNCSMLRKERKAFMEKLRTSRYIRTVVENGAATAIQKAFRRFFVLVNLDRIREECLVHKRLREMVREYLLQQESEVPGKLKSDLLYTPSMHRKSYSDLRYRCARRIQCVYRKFMSRRVLRQRRYDAFVKRRRTAALRIQCMARRKAAVALVNLLRTRRKISRFTRSAVLIQNRVRIMFARRLVRKLRLKFRHIAARMIQCWYRAKHSKWKTSKLKELIIRQKRFIGAIGLQGLVRRKVARHRVYRLRLRRLFLFVFMSVLKIQCMVRRRLGLLRVRRLRAEALKAKKEKQAQSLVNGADASEKKQADAIAEAEAAKQAEFNDIYCQIKLGNATRVEDIFHGAGGACAARDPSHVNSEGDTLLTLAALYGHVDIVNKCVVWQLDVNHRNREGLNALMLAVRHAQTEVVQFLLSAPIKLKLDPTALIQDDAAFLLIAAIESIGKAALRGDAKKKDLIEQVKALLQTHGLSTSINSKDTRFHNMTPLHMAARIGVPEVFSVVVKLRPQTDAVDDLGQTALHKACLSPLAQIDTVKALLGLDHQHTGIVVPETKRSALLLRVDAQGKDCSLLAAIAGQTTVLNFLVDFLQTDKHHSHSDAPAAAVPISWTDEDIRAALRLAQGGNDVCLSFMISRGFDPAVPTADSGVTLGMAACQYGHLLFVNVLLEHGVQIMTPKDCRGRTAMHYAATCPTAGALVAHLLVHEKAKQCGIDEMCLAVQDDEGLTPLHLAGMSGVEISVDLLARRGLAKALETRDNSPEGLTPLLTAARFQNKKVLALYLRMSEDAKARDRSGRNALWWFFHPAPVPADDVLEPGVMSRPPGSASEALRRPPSSEFMARRGLQSKMAKREREDAAQALETDIQTIKALLALGCSLYIWHKSTPAEMLNFAFDPNSEVTVEPSVRANLDAGDLLVQEMSFTALKAIPECLTHADAWRLALACIRFDDGTSKALKAFLDGGAVDVLVNSGAPKKESNSKSTALLSSCFYCGLTLAGWCISLGNNSALRLLLKGGVDPMAPVTTSGGNGCLHLAAAVGLGSMIDTILEDPKVVIEAENSQGYTALMEAARVGNQKTAKRLVVYKASARRGMDGKYWGWMLAFARKQEETEKNLQTGRVGDDDERYFWVKTPGWILLSMRGK